MMRKTAIAALAAWLTTGTASAQYIETKTDDPFQHLNVGVTMGTTGLGVELSSPLTRTIHVRTGFEYMPRWEKTLTFDLQTFSTEGVQLESTFDRMADLLESFTGYRASPNVDMIAKPTMWNFKLLFDIYPFRNKHWHVTAGFHWGPSKIGEAINSIDVAPSLVAANMYNHLYHLAYEDKYNDNLIPMFVFQDGTEVYLEPYMRDAVLSTGHLAIHLGDYTHDVTDEEGNVVHKKGDAYLMTPDENSTVSAKCYTNSFKPYLGFGYDGRLAKKDPTWHIGFDAGLMFWGGTPNVVTHDGTSLTHDVSGIDNRVGDYVKLIKGVKVFPVVNLRITKQIF
jgi:hypothetical protein